MTKPSSLILVVVALAAILLCNVVVTAFAPIASSAQRRRLSPSAPMLINSRSSIHTTKSSSSSVSLAPEDTTTDEMSEPDQVLLGAIGTFASLVTFYSEFTLKTTGCGLPAGPFGLVGLVEGLSYLGVTGLVAYSIVTKVKTVSSWKEISCAKGRVV
jgi:hypothetical protein